MMRRIKELTFICLVGVVSFACESEEISDPVTDDPIEIDPVSDPSLTGTIKEQYEKDLEIYTELQNGSYTIDNPYVVVDPYGVSPLSAYVVFQTEDAVSITVSVEDKDGAVSLSHSFDEKNTDHYIPVYGLFENYENTVILKTSDDEETSVTIATDLVEDAAEAEIVTASNSVMAEGLTMTIRSGGSIQTAYDSEGNLRMAFTDSFLGAGNNFFKAENGNFLASAGEITKQPYYTDEIYEFNCMGKIIAQYNVPNGAHHDIRELPSGNLLVATNDGVSSTSEDVVIEISRSSGDIVKTWNLEDYVPKDAGTSLLDTGDDWFHNNSVFYDEENDQLILSGRHRDAVIAIDYYDDKLNWIFGTSEGWDSSMNPYFFTPIGADFEWQWGQHSAIMTDNGNLFLFDNGNHRSKTQANAIDDADNYSRAVLYSIDTNEMETAQLFEFGKNRGSEFYSSYISEVNYIADNHYLIVSGAASPSNTSFAPPSNNRPPVDSNSEYGVVVEIVNDQVVFEMNISEATYRVERFDPYSDNGLQFLDKGTAY